MKPSAAGALPSQLLQGENMKVARDVLDDGDADEVENEVEKIKTTLKEKTARAPLRTSSPAGPSGSGAAPAAEAMGPPLKPGSNASSASGTRVACLTRGQAFLSADDVRAFAPPVAKSTMGRESHWYHRWRGQYDGKRTSKVFVKDDANSEYSVVLHCLTFCGRSIPRRPASHALGRSLHDLRVAWEICAEPTLCPRRALVRASIRQRCVWV